MFNNRAAERQRGRAAERGRRAMRALTLIVPVFIAMPARTQAQVAWESPQLVAPGSPRGVSLLLVDYGLSPHRGTGLLLAWRTAAAPHGWRVRVSSTFPGDDRLRVAGGIDVALPLFSRSATLPLDVIWTSGIGGGYGDYGSIAVPVGVSAGRTLGTRMLIAPYTGARLVLERHFGGGSPAETFDAALAAEVGMDLWLKQTDSVRLRAAVSLGDRRALAIGMHVGTTRPPVAAYRH